jgi:predicted nucleic acid-binding protein
LCDPFISPIVLEEVERGDTDAAQLRREMIAGLPVLEIVPEVGRLAEAYFEATVIPEKARADSYHLALAAWHGMEYLLSWNCTHIVSGRVRRQIEEINAKHGIRTPVMCTPEELMEV